MVSIRSYLATRLLTGFIAVIGLGSVLVYFISDRILETDFDSRLFAKAQAVIASTSQKGTQLDLDWNNLPKEIDQHGRHTEWVEIFDSSGRLVEGENFLDAGAVKESQEISYANTHSLTGRKLRIVRLNFTPSVEEEDRPLTPPELRKPCLLIVGSDRKQLDHSLLLIGFVLLGVTVVASGLSLGIVIQVLRRGLRPLDTVGKQVAAIDEANLNRRIEIEHLPEEVIPMAEKLNELLNRLEISFSRERQFSADVSHELRTPVAELRTLAEVRLQNPDLPTEVRQDFEDALAIARQMESLVMMLLEIVRQERDGSSLQRSQVDLEYSLFKTWNNLRSKANRREIALNSNLTTNAVILWTEPHLLSTVLTNLLDNAIEYSPTGSVVAVEWKKLEKNPCLMISNTAANLSQADLTHLFDRFWRKDKARSESGRFGIGLALTRTICQRLGIRLTVSMDGENIIHFGLHFLPNESTSPS